MKIKLTAISYYWTSALTLMLRSNFWIASMLVLGKKAKIRVKNGLQFATDNFMDYWAIKEVVLDDCYNAGKRQGNVAIDIGGGVGDFAILVAPNFNKVVTYEPDKQKVGFLKDNLTLNGINNVVVIAERCRSLDKVFITNRIKRCEVLKIDCEGDEYAIFAATKLITLKKINYIAMEVHFFETDHRVKYSKLIEKLSRLGFVLQEVANPVHPNIAYLFATNVRFEK